MNSPMTESSAQAATQSSRAQPSSLSRTLYQARKWLMNLDQLSYWIIVAVMGLMVVIVSVQVLCRYALGTSIDSADELARLFFVWTIFLAIPHGIKRGVHVGIDLLVIRLPEKPKENLFRVIALVSCALMLMVMLGAYQATLDRWPELMPTLPITSAVYYIALLICGAHSLLHLLILVWGGSTVWEQEL